jgi:hypothetical protein
MSTDSLGNAAALMTSRATNGSSTIESGERHPYPRYDALDAFPALCPSKGASARLSRRGAAIVVACLIEAALILGFVVASLGLGYESYSVVAPGRPPPMTPAPAPPPPPPVIPQ